MNLVSPSQVKAFLEKKGIHPNKTLGQNFLIDGNILKIIIDAAELSEDDYILEIGPGLGVLTQRLVASGARVSAVEKDSALCSCLQEILSAEDSLDICCGDMMDVGVRGYMEAGVNKMVSNLPYSVGTRILLDLACDPQPPELMVVTVQLEVAQRITAVPGGKDYGMLSAWTQLIYDVELVRTIKPTCFFPRPAIESGIVKLTRRDRAFESREMQEKFCALTKQSFMHRRKQLAPILSRLMVDPEISADDARDLLESLGADPKARPENLSVEQWCSLTRKLEGSLVSE